MTTTSKIVVPAGKTSLTGGKPQRFLEASEV